MLVTVWHANPSLMKELAFAAAEDLPFMASTGWRNGNYLEAAGVEVHPEGHSISPDELEPVYRLTNTIEHVWTENDGATATGASLRSTSAGDILEADGRLFLVLAAGFVEIRPGKAPTCSWGSTYNADGPEPDRFGVDVFETIEGGRRISLGKEDTALFNAMMNAVANIPDASSKWPMARQILLRGFMETFGPA